MGNRVEAGKAYVSDHRALTILYVHDVEDKERFGRPAQLAKVTRFVIAPDDSIRPLSEQLYGTMNSYVVPVWVGSEFGMTLKDSFLSELPIGMAAADLDKVKSW